MTMTKTTSRKTWYTYGHGPLIVSIQKRCDFALAFGRPLSSLPSLSSILLLRWPDSSESF